MSYLTAFSNVPEINLHWWPGGAQQSGSACCGPRAPLLQPSARAPLWASTPLLHLCHSHPRAHQLVSRTLLSITDTATFFIKLPRRMWTWTRCHRGIKKSEHNKARTRLNTWFYCTVFIAWIVAAEKRFIMSTVGFEAFCSEKKMISGHSDGVANFIYLSPCPSTTRPALTYCI